MPESAELFDAAGERSGEVEGSGYGWGEGGMDVPRFHIHCDVQVEDNLGYIHDLKASGSAGLRHFEA
jgi:hypothetical protein